MHKMNSIIILSLLISFTVLSSEINKAFPVSLEDRLKNGEVANILLIGTDARPEEVNGRSDTIMLLSINDQIKQVAVISIPRDTRIVFKGKNTKINMVNQLQGPDALCQEISDLMGLRVQHYILTSFNGFEDIIDQLGGIYLEVDIDIHSPSTGVYLSKGYQCLNGQEALTYVRFRSDSDGDIGRIDRQQRFVSALTEQILKKENLARLPGIANKMKENIATNISLRDMLYLVRLTPGFKSENLITQTLPGYHYWSPYSGASFWEVDPEIARSLIDSLFNGHRYNTYLDAPPWVNS
ncbi:cell envelope-associated transcriptional attenuator lytr-cpsa-psr, subfamily m [hydrocarbon metagenome]|uniref:Cell envelope-associated transcriptional attenuator lytr-cpsa-psr, subfamily m n=1 Tax=hydrocarbon metagenome TaxID=938273 RepID=A0A0W8E173_9ZZZZ